MKFFARNVALLVSAALLAGSAMVSGAASGTPVERVVDLLKDLKERLELDQEAEEKVYNKYACWCEKTTARKASSITEAQTQLRALGQDILTHKGKIASLIAEIAKFEAEMANVKKEELDATSIRQNENGAFVSESEETKEAIAALEKAITVLLKGTKQSSLIQQRSSTELVAALRGVVEAIPASKSLKPEQLSLLSVFMSEDAGAKYTPQSGTVQGMLKDMYQTFANDLQTQYEEESKGNTGFEAFVAVKDGEYEELKKTKEGLEQDKATVESMLADAQQMYDDTTAQKDADIAFFDETKDVCKTKHAQWTARLALHKEEVEGVAKALGILTSDEARENFASAIKPGKEVGADDSLDTGVDISFIQVDASMIPAQHAYDSLKAQARASHSLRLAALAVQVKAAKAGHFDEVLKSIDDMVQVLKDENQADIEKRDQCKEEYAKTDSTIKEESWNVEKNEAKIDKLEKGIEKFTEEKTKAIADIKEVDGQMAALTKDREADHKAFGNAKKEDQTAIKTLIEARKALSAYYTKNSIEMGPLELAQEPEFGISADQAPDATISDKGKRKGESKVILSLLTSIIEDLDDEIKNGMTNEEVAQLDYEKQTDTSKALRESIVVTKNSLTASIAKNGMDKGAEDLVKKANENDVKLETQYKESITPDCEWILGAFEKRAAARSAEMDGLEGAKKYLAGYKAPALIEEGKASGKAFDDNVLRRIRFLGLA